MSSKLLTAAVSAALLAGLPIISNADDGGSGVYQHVLLLSIDGMHAVDFENCAKGGYCPTLAGLASHGVTYTRTSTSKPSDSFPGLTAIISGGTPRSFGVYYDVAYDRVLAPPTITTGNGVAGTGPTGCIPNVPNGTTTEYEEGIDKNQAFLDGVSSYSETGGGVDSIDPLKLPRDPYKNCAPVYPWNFVRSNTVFGVVHGAGGYTAWSDKHPAYSSVNGPGDATKPTNLDDFYAPEINSAVVALPGITTALGASCSSIRDPNTDLSAWTNGFGNIQCYDQLKVNAIVNEASGKTHDGSKSAPTPTVFGMNFQAVSVGQKLIEGGTTAVPCVTTGTVLCGGYTDAQGTPTAVLKNEVQFVDAAIAQMVAALHKKGVFDQTLIIVTAKHGQSPIDPSHYVRHGDNDPATLIQSLLPYSESPANPNGIGPTEDDVALLWLADGSAANVTSAVQTLENNAALAGIDEMYYGRSLETMIDKPGIPPNGDSRTPDIIVLPHIGTTYSNSKAKQAEHGGFAPDDTNVMLVVSNPSIEAKRVNSFVETAQVAPTILQALGLNPQSLQAVRSEGTPVLPGLF
jgi:hypothetical protein